MIAEKSEHSERDERLGEIVAACLKAAEEGRPLDRQAVLARHPEFADELAEYFHTREELDDLAAPLRQAVRGTPLPLPVLPEDGRLGDFRLLRQIGKGGMGVVYEAEQISLSRKVALKLLPMAGALDPRHLQRFKNESLAAAQL